MSTNMKSPEFIDELKTAMDDYSVEDSVKANDPVNHPSHYTRGGIEVLDFIKAYFWDCFHLAQVCKYISRAGHKDPKKELEDLKKAQFYLNDYIKELEGGHRR